MLDLWKAAAPDIDILSPDTSKQPFGNFRMIILALQPPDNPYWSPEAGRTMSGARVFFYALANYNGHRLRRLWRGLGRRSGAGEPAFVDLGADYRLIKSAMPAIIDLQQKGKLKAAIEEEVVRGKNLIFDRYHILVRFLPSCARHASASPVPSAPRAGGRVGAGRVSGHGLSSRRSISGPRWDRVSPRPNSFRSSKGSMRTGMENDQRGRTYQGSYDPPSVCLPAQGAIFRVKLMRY